MVRRSLFAGEAHQRKYPTPSAIPIDLASKRWTALIAEKSPAFDGVRHRYRHHVLPQAVVVFDAPKSIAREYAQDFRVESDDALDAVILQQKRIEACKVVDNSQVLRVDQHIR